MDKFKLIFGTALLAYLLSLFVKQLYKNKTVGVKDQFDLNDLKSRQKIILDARDAWELEEEKRQAKREWPKLVKKLNKDPTSSFKSSNRFVIALAKETGLRAIQRSAMSAEHLIFVPKD